MPILRDTGYSVRSSFVLVIPVIPFYAEVQRIRETIETVAKGRIPL